MIPKWSCFINNAGSFQLIVELGKYCTLVKEVMCPERGLMSMVPSMPLEITLLFIFGIKNYTHYIHTIKCQPAIFTGRMHQLLKAI